MNVTCDGDGWCVVVAVVMSVVSALRMMAGVTEVLMRTIVGLSARLEGVGRAGGGGAEGRLSLAFSS